MTEPLTDQPEPGSLHVEHLDEMSAQQCPAGKHADWAVNSEYAHACPWCEIARLRADLASYQAESAQYDRDHERLGAELEQARAVPQRLTELFASGQHWQDGRLVSEHIWTCHEIRAALGWSKPTAAIAAPACSCAAEPVHQAGCDTT